MYTSIYLFIYLHIYALVCLFIHSDFICLFTTRFLREKFNLVRERDSACKKRVNEVFEKFEATLEEKLKAGLLEVSSLKIISLLIVIYVLAAN